MADAINTENWQQLNAKLDTPCQTIMIEGTNVVVKRDDLNHPIIQGNKLRKLKYNLIAALKNQADTLITFGGAYSNHLLATAYAAHCIGMKVVGIVRGDELADNQTKWSETLIQCQNYGMKLVFVSRAEYRAKENSKAVKDCLAQYSDYWMIPEGGSNRYALDGVAELVDELNRQLPEPPTHLFCPIGTGGTFAGLVKGVSRLNWRCKLFGTVVLKSLHSVNNDINQWLTELESVPEYEILHDFHGGGYAKNTEELINFRLHFERQHQIQLDKIYNNKSFYALKQMIQSGDVSGADRPVIIHTGGIQGGANQ